MMDEMGNSYQALVDRLSRVMQEVDKQPLGTDLSNTPLFPALEEELKSMQAFWSAVQTVGGGLLVYQWQLRCYNQVSGP